MLTKINSAPCATENSGSNWCSWSLWASRVWTGVGAQSWTNSRKWTESNLPTSCLTPVGRCVLSTAPSSACSPLGLMYVETLCVYYAAKCFSIRAINRVVYHWHGDCMRATVIFVMYWHVDLQPCFRWLCSVIEMWLSQRHFRCIVDVYSSRGYWHWRAVKKMVTGHVPSQWTSWWLKQLWVDWVVCWAFWLIGLRKCHITKISCRSLVSIKPQLSKPDNGKNGCLT